MYKKLLGILVIAVFLITSVGAISASDSISVKVTWDGGDAPDSVTVNLIKDGNVVDSAKLSASNSWKTTFKVDDDGLYKVSEVVSGDYSYSVSGNANSGFVISNKLVKTDDVLATSVDDAVADSSADDAVSNGAEDVLNENETSSDENSTETDGGNTTEDTNATDEDNVTEGTDVTEDDNVTEDEEITETITTTTTEHQITKTANQADKKKPVNHTAKVKNRNAGFPIAVLVCAVFAAAFMPLSRRK